MGNEWEACRIFWCLLPSSWAILRKMWWHTHIYAHSTQPNIHIENRINIASTCAHHKVWWCLHIQYGLILCRRHTKKKHKTLCEYSLRWIVVEERRKEWDRGRKRSIACWCLFYSTDGTLHYSFCNTIRVHEHWLLLLLLHCCCDFAYMCSVSHIICFLRCRWWRQTILSTIRTSRYSSMLR